MSEQITFTFALAGTQKDEIFQVLTFTGDEGISRLYEFNIELLSDNADADIDAILQQPATLTLSQGDDVRIIQGIISHFDAVRQINNQVLYKARLVPRLWELSLYHTNEVYLDMTVPEIIEAVLAEGGFESVDYDIADLQGDYKKWAYKCQYGETHLDFISRLMERDGIYYYFTEGDVGEKIVFCDQMTMQEALPEAAVQYSAASSLEINTLPNTVNSFVSQQKRLPYRVMLKDYNDDKPSVDVKGEAIIDGGANKSSEIYVWGQNIETPEEGEQLAQVRAEQILAGKKVFHGESSVNRLIPGYFFTLQGHFRSACNQDYCLVSLHHQGTDRRLVDGANGGQAPAYSNELTAQPADVQYRPALETPRPEIHGVLNAYVDSEGDGHYAEIDEEGRYRILLPFDRIDRDGGKASHWIRMSQPFAGENQGMHFPLRKGTEVLLTFVGGDPDRPVIAGSMPNAGAPSVINAENHTNSLIQTKAGNRIELEDKDGKNRIKFETPQNGTYMHLGAPNHPGDGWVVVSDGIERKEISGGQQITILTTSTSSTLSTATNLTSDASGLGYGGNVAEGSAPLDTFKFVERKSPLVGDGANDEAKAKWMDSKPSGDPTTAQIDKWSLLGTNQTGTTDNQGGELSGDYIVSRISGTRYSWKDGVEFNYGEGNIYSFGSSQEVTHWNRFDLDEAAGLLKTMQDYKVDGLKVYTGNPNHEDSGTDTTETNYKNTADTKRTALQAYQIANQNIWDRPEGQNLTNYGYPLSYFEDVWSPSHGSHKMSGFKEALDEIKSEVDGWVSSPFLLLDSTTRNNIKTFLTTVIGYCQSYKTYKEYKEKDDWGYILEHGEVQLKQTDTFTAQNGNIYHFGGHWNSNLGNSYEENHIDQDTSINAKVGKDKAAAGGPSFGNAEGKKVTVSADKGWVTKNYGDAYEFTKGNSLEVFEGTAESHHFGNTYDYHTGDTHEEIMGNSTIKFGKPGSVDKVEERFYGIYDGIHMGVNSELKIAISNELYIGGKSETTVLGENDFNLGFWMEIGLGAKLALQAGVELEKKTARLRSSEIELENKLSAITSNISDIKTQVNSIENCQANLSTNVADIRNAVIELLS